MWRNLPKLSVQKCSEFHWSSRFVRVAPAFELLERRSGKYTTQEREKQWPRTKRGNKLGVDCVLQLQSFVSSQRGAVLFSNCSLWSEQVALSAELLSDYKHTQNNKHNRLPNRDASYPPPHCVSLLQSRNKRLKCIKIIKWSSRNVIYDLTAFLTRIYLSRRQELWEVSTCQLRLRSLEVYRSST